jgi:UDP:flavonoid glycosyltransferase YjiC (YdhE family)
VRYVGPVLDDPAGLEAWQSPWPPDHPDPLVVVAFSTTYQEQSGALQRVIDALGMLEARGLVTLGPALDAATFRAPPNVIVRSSAPHSLVFPHAAAVVTHAGHGTVIRALACGVPLLCMPMGRAQPGNAARVVARGAGLRLAPEEELERLAIDGARTPLRSRSIDCLPRIA